MGVPPATDSTHTSFQEDYAPYIALYTILVLGLAQSAYIIYLSVRHKTIRVQLQSQMEQIQQTASSLETKVRDLTSDLAVSREQQVQCEGRKFPKFSLFKFFSGSGKAKSSRVLFWAKWKARAAKYARAALLGGGVLVILTLCVAGVLAIAHIFPPALIPLLGAVPAALSTLCSMYDRACELCSTLNNEAVLCISPMIADRLEELQSNIESLGGALENASNFMNREELEMQANKVNQAFDRIAKGTDLAGQIHVESFGGSNQLRAQENSKEEQNAAAKNVKLAAAILKALPETQDNIKGQAGDFLSSMIKRTKQA